MKTKRIILFLAAAALFTGCFKDVSYKTTYVFKPLEQEKSGDPTQILADAKLYAFAADTSSWEVASYKDALAGVISQRGNRNEKISTPLAAGEPYEQEVEIVEGGQPVNFLPVVFRPWKQEYLYVEEGGWRVVNDKLAPKEPEKASKR